jgi:hypothetical protein
MKANKTMRRQTALNQKRRNDKESESNIDLGAIKPLNNKN